MRHFNGEPGLELTGTVEPGASGRAIGKDAITVRFNDRTIRRSLYAFDASTGAFSLRLDAGAMRLLEATVPYGVGALGAPKPPENKLGFEVVTQDGDARIERSFHPLADLVKELMGAEAPGPNAVSACVASHHGAPGREAREIGLREDREVALPQPGERTQAWLLDQGAGAWLVQGGAARLLPIAVEPREADRAFIASVTPAPAVRAVQMAPLHAYAVATAPGRVLVQGAGRRFELQRTTADVEGLAADDQRAILGLAAGALEAHAWDGKLTWRQPAWPGLERGAVRYAASGMGRTADGGILVATAGRATLDGVEMPFLAVRGVDARGQTTAASLLLDPSPAPYDIIEDARAVTFHGRVFGVVTSSRPSGYDLLTRVYDMAAPAGVPVFQLEKTTAGTSPWTWGAVAAGDRLAIGRGDTGVVLLAPVERATR